MKNLMIAILVLWVGMGFAQTLSEQVKSLDSELTQARDDVKQKKAVLHQAEEKLAQLKEKHQQVLQSGPLADFLNQAKQKGLRITEEARLCLKKLDLTAGDPAVDFSLITTYKIVGKNGNRKRGNIYAKLPGRLLVGKEILTAILQESSKLKDIEYFWVAMEPVESSLGVLSVFRVARDDDGTLWLVLFYAYPGTFWYPDNRWVFVSRK